MKQYGKIIAQLRKENNLTQAELGAKLNVTYQAVSKWENDQSQPDFTTMAQIAEIFHVPLTIFLNGEDSEAATALAPAENSAEPVLGYCTVCGNAVRQENVAQQRPVLICKNCAEEAEKQRAEAARKMKLAEEAKKIAKHQARNRGLIWAAIITGIMLIICIFGAVFSKSKALDSILLTLASCLFCYTFSAQMFWDGFVFDACLFGGKIIGTPGIIFSFDLDGFVFLIAIKIFFALLRLLVFVVTFLLSAIFAIIISPFTFVPALVRVNRYGLDEG